MRIVAIDASPRVGVVSLSVEQTARAAERVGAEVERVRLSEMDIRGCTSCGICGGSGVCKIGDDLPRLVEMILASDGIIIGTPGLSGPEAARTQALVDRIGGFAAAMSAQRHPAAPRRAVVITACRSPEPLSSIRGEATTPIRSLRTALETTGTRTIGSLVLGVDWLGRTRVGQSEHDAARSLGRVLAGRV